MSSALVGQGRIRTEINRTATTCRASHRRLGGVSRPSVEQLQTDDVLVAHAEEHVVAIPEDGPSVLAVDLAGVDLLLELELVAAQRGYGRSAGAGRVRSRCAPGGPRRVDLAGNCSSNVSTGCGQ